MVLQPPKSVSRREAFSNSDVRFVSRHKPATPICVADIPTEEFCPFGTTGTALADRNDLRKQQRRARHLLWS